MSAWGELRSEWSRLSRAERGSQEDKDRKTLGWMLIMFGLFGVPMLLLAVFLIAVVITAAF